MNDLASYFNPPIAQAIRVATEKWQAANPGKKPSARSGLLPYLNSNSINQGKLQAWLAAGP